MNAILDAIPDFVQNERRQSASPSPVGKRRMVRFQLPSRLLTASADQMASETEPTSWEEFAPRNALALGRALQSPRT